MPDPGLLQEFLVGGQVDAAVFALRSDYRAMLLVARARAGPERPGEPFDTMADDAAGSDRWTAVATAPARR
jgi:hypothetical protein